MLTLEVRSIKRIVITLRSNLHNNPPYEITLTMSEAKELINKLQEAVNICKD